jgi:hypothetical protein
MGLPWRVHEARIPTVRSPRLLGHRPGVERADIDAADAVVTVPLQGPGNNDPLTLTLTHSGSGGGVLVSWTVAGGTYDVITGLLGGFTVLDSELRIGNVEVLGAGLAATSVLDDPPRLQPAPGQAVFYLVQYHDGLQATGYGTEPVPWPRVPTACAGGCP